jgi:pyruvate kinase
MQKKTKIICTISPALNKTIIGSLMDKGMDVARLNFSHATPEDGLRMVNELKDIRNEKQVPLSIMLDTKGPEVRIYGKKEPVSLKQNDVIRVFSYEQRDIAEQITTEHDKFLTNLPTIGNLTTIGGKVLLMDGFIEASIVDKDQDWIAIKIMNKGKLRPKAHLSIPNLNYPLPFITEKDEDDIKFAVKHHLDYIALSFVREKKDIMDVRNIIMDTDNNSKIKIISKIENKQAIENFDEIMRLSDGIMVARGDLGVELPLEEVPIMQKQIIGKCYRTGKPVITATQMLESMIDNRVPTRAEASDVANACYDLTSLVMLSGETAIGKYPELVVDTMANIIRRVERSYPYQQTFYNRGKIKVSNDLTTIISYNAISAAYQSDAQALIVFTKSGHSARMLSKQRSGLPIYAFTLDEQVYHQLAMNWGVYPTLIKEEKDFEQLIHNSLEICENNGWLKKGDITVVVAGLPLGKRGTTNMIRIETVGKSTLKGKTVHKGIVDAPVVFVNNYEELLKKDIVNKIVVLKHFTSDYTESLKLASGIVMETFGFEQQLDIVGRAYNIPILVGVKGALTKINEGASVELNADKEILIDI